MIRSRVFPLSPFRVGEALFAFFFHRYVELRLCVATFVHVAVLR